MPEQVYIVSILVFTSNATVNGGAMRGLWVTHIPTLVSALSAEAAAEQIREQALAKWKTQDGWHGHQANITPVTNEFHGLFESNRIGEIAETELETELPGKCFELGPNGIKPMEPTSGK